MQGREKWYKWTTTTNSFSAVEFYADGYIAEKQVNVNADRFVFWKKDLYTLYMSRAKHPGDSRRARALGRERVRQKSGEETPEKLLWSSEVLQLAQRAKEMLQETENPQEKQQIVSLTAGISAIVDGPPLLWFQQYRDEDDMRTSQVRAKRIESRTDVFTVLHQIDHQYSDIILQLKLLAQALEVADRPAALSRWSRERYVNEENVPVAIEALRATAQKLSGQFATPQVLKSALEKPDREILNYLLIYGFHTRIFIREADRAEKSGRFDNLKHEDPARWKMMVSLEREARARRRREVLKWYVLTGEFNPQPFGNPKPRKEYALSPLSVAQRGEHYPPIIIGGHVQEGRAVVGGQETTRNYVSLAHPIELPDLLQAKRWGLPPEAELQVDDPTFSRYDRQQDSSFKAVTVWHNKGFGERIGQTYYEPADPHSDMAVRAFASWLSVGLDANTLPPPWNEVVYTNKKNFWELQRYWVLSKHSIPEPPLSLEAWYTQGLKKMDQASGVKDLLGADTTPLELRLADYIDPDMARRLDTQYPKILKVGKPMPIQYVFKGEGEPLQPEVHIPLEESRQWLELVPDEPDEYRVGPEDQLVEFSVTRVFTRPKDQPQFKQPIFMINSTSISEIKQRAKEFAQQLKEVTSEED